MKRIKFTFLLLIACFWLALPAFSQISDQSQPYSFGKQLNLASETIELPRISQEVILSADAATEKNGGIYKIAHSIPVELNMNNAGEWTILPDGSRVWTLHIESQGALALGVYYKRFKLPQGAKLHLYNRDKSHVIGGFTAQNNPKSKEFATELVQGDRVTLEYFQPAGTTEPAVLEISEIAYAFRDVHFLFGKDFGDSDACQIPINCPEGANWQDEKRGVARILTKSPDGYGWCTGSLVNNVRSDATPYFLTAFHCGDGSTTSDFNQWIFYFNYEAAGCDFPTQEPNYNTTTGSTLRSQGEIGGGSDFILLELNATIPNSYEPYYNGWDATGSPSSSGVGIHHPSGDIKMISTYNSTLTSASPNIGGSQMASNSTWRVSWAATTSGQGVTEPGSSGSPLFNSTGKIVGTLSGGSSSCDNPSFNDYYGKVSYHWEDNGNTAAERLKDWLDPDNTGTTTMEGYDPVGSNFPPPKNLTGEIIDTVNIQLNWNAPDDPASTSQWYAYTTFDDCGSILATYPTRVSEFSAAGAGFSYPATIEKIKHGFWNNYGTSWTDSTFRFIIYDSDMETVLYESDNIEAVHATEVEHVLATPLEVNDTFYAGIVTEDADGTPHTLFQVVAADAGHSYVNDGTDWLYADTGTEGYEFLTGVYVESGGKKALYTSSAPAKAKVHKTIPQGQLQALAGEKNAAKNTKEGTLSGYVVYRNSTAITDTLPTTQTSYLDESLSNGSYAYCIKAVYTTPDGESHCSNVVTLSITNSFTIRFFVKNSEYQVLEGANVAFNNQNIVSDATGLSEFTGVSGGIKHYVVSADGYENKEADINVDDDKDIMVVLQQTTAIDQLGNSDHLAVYPNPNNGEFQIKFDAPFRGQFKVNIYNAQGSLVHQSSPEKTQNKAILPLNLSQKASGVYWLQIVAGNQVFNQKLILK